MKPAKSFSLDVALAQKRSQKFRSSGTGLSEDLKEMLVEAQEQDRLTCGVYESGKLLEMNPEGIMLCVLPENSASDVTLHIHLTLIEAFCWENDIGIIKVDSVEKLAKLLDVVEETNNVENQALVWSKKETGPAPVDYNCILIEYPTGKCSPAEEKLLDFHRITCDLVPQPVISLED